MPSPMHREIVIVDSLFPISKEINDKTVYAVHIAMDLMGKRPCMVSPVLSAYDVK
jgi:hypothetical protein